MQDIYLALTIQMNNEPCNFITEIETQRQVPHARSALDLYDYTHLWPCHYTEI